MSTGKDGGDADRGGAPKGADRSGASQGGASKGGASKGASPGGAPKGGASKGQRTRASGSGPAAARGGGPVAGRGGGAAAPAGRPAAGAPLTPGRVGLYVLLLVAGVLLAIAGSLLQGAWSPGGLLLALAGLAGLFHGGGRATGTAGGVLVPGAAWLVTVFLLISDVRPEGDFLFGPGLGSYAFLLGGMVIAVICATGTRLRAVAPPPGRVGG
ncbi:DUF6113 family protein [Streptomyces sp. NRRL F-4489]|uniref:DUF6113 family protein n=1 Tax=Streptomyces sp. NRRL F-4489 TaxID=1609095 RepID=UPI00082F6252|nr:DUF6113 family protein [Streptomyces sp. NRRL F-4489]